MPRGGRGGGSSFRAKPKQGTARIAGIDIAYDDDLEKHINDAKPAELFPVSIYTRKI